MISSISAAETCVRFVRQRRRMRRRMINVLGSYTPHRPRSSPFSKDFRVQPIPFTKLNRLSSTPAPFRVLVQTARQPSLSVSMVIFSKHPAEADGLSTDSSFSSPLLQILRSSYKLRPSSYLCLMFDHLKSAQMDGWPAVIVSDQMTIRQYSQADSWQPGSLSKQLPSQPSMAPQPHHGAPGPVMVRQS